MPEFRQLLDEGLRRIGALARAVRAGGRPGKLTPLRSLHAELVEALGELADPRVAPELAASVIEATDRMVNSLDSIAAILTERARTAAGS